jgi:hypothetical protein
MRKILAFMLLLAGALSAQSAPFLTCDPYPTNADANLNVVSFVITFTAPTGISPVTVQARVGTGGMQYLFYDVGPLGNATYTVTAAAVNGYALESPQSVPFTFQKGIPTAPTGMKIVPSIPVPLP